MNLKEIQPVLLSCDRTGSYIHETLQSYKECKLDSLLPPRFVCVDKEKDKELSREYLMSLHQ